MLIGVAMVEGVNYMLESSGSSNEMFQRPEVDFPIAITALAILAFTGALAGLVPARRAVRIKPIDALRDE